MQSVDANGSVVESEYDAADRLVQRTLVAAAEGVIGPTSESYGYDGLSRLVEETTAGRQVRYELDAVGNPQRTEYPSGLQVTQAFDALDRPLSVAMGTDGTPGSLVASYGYQGPYLRASKGYGSGQTATSTFDADRRLLSQRLPGPDDATVFEEALRWRGPPTLFLAARAYLHFCARIHALIGSSVCLVPVQSAALLAEVVARRGGGSLVRAYLAKLDLVS